MLYEISDIHHRNGTIRMRDVRKVFSAGLGVYFLRNLSRTLEAAYRHLVDRLTCFPLRYLSPSSAPSSPSLRGEDEQVASVMIQAETWRSMGCDIFTDQIVTSLVLNLPPSFSSLFDFRST